MTCFHSHSYYSYMVSFLNIFVKNTSDNYLKIKNHFRKYLKKNCLCCVVSSITPLNIFLSMHLPERFHQNCQAAFGHRKHWWVKLTWQKKWSSMFIRSLPTGMGNYRTGGGASTHFSIGIGTMKTFVILYNIDISLMMQYLNNIFNNISCLLVT